MRFRQHQDDARLATRRLLVLFALLLALLVVAVNALLWGAWWFFGTWLSPNLPPLFFETNTALVLMFVLGGALVELGRLRSGGGAHVAQWAGGTLLADPRGPLERRLSNVVDEMALATGLPRPAVYVIERENAINAFAAGWLPENSVIAVTRGALERLTRDELQGLVAHEFGHIQQGDLRLNMQLLALVWGLGLVHGYGRTLMQADLNGRRSPVAVLIGAAFVAAGWLGWLCGRILQAAVSRQRELLADACAVQYTRSREGLGGTLRKVWHQADRHEDALVRVPVNMMAAMLLQAPAGWLRTHPPLKDRLRRLYGRTVAPLPSPVLEVKPDAEPMPRAPLVASGLDAPLAYAVAPAGGDVPVPPAAPAHVPRPVCDESQREAIERLSRLHGSGELRAAILALLLTPGSRRERRAWRDETRGLSSAHALREDVARLGPAARLPWLEQLLVRVAAAPMPDRQVLVEAARRVMTADGQLRPIDRLHWLLMRERLGGPQPVQPAAAGVRQMSELSLHNRRQIARLTAFLSRIVPDGDAGAGSAWYGAVMAPWLAGEALPAPGAPDGGELVEALGDVQKLPWMLKPVLVRAWLDAALARAGGVPLSPEAADALRIASRLLDSPVPPELGRYYLEPAA